MRRGWRPTSSIINFGVLCACGKKTRAPRRKYALHLPIYLKLTSVRRQVNLIGWTKADNNSRAHQLGEGSQREAENACVIT